MLSQTFSVAILDDADFEGNEMFALGLSNATGGASLGTPASATVTITENDAPPPAGSLQFSGSTYAVAEDGTSLLVTVTRTGGSFGTVGVDYASTDGNATAGSGTAVLLISSDLPELVGLADRAVVMRNGHLIGEMKKEELSEEAVLLAANGQGVRAYV